MSNSIRAVRRGGGQCVALMAYLLTAVPLAASAGDAPDSSDQLAEIIVTSQKRTEDIKDIPISVSAISGAQLQEYHIANYDDITRTVPGVSFQAGAGPGLDNIEIRGVSSTSGSATVGIYIDEVSVTTKNLFDGAVQPKLFDLDRVEVLRGPQGTLYGASSMGGTVRFITKQPDLDAFSASVSTDLSVTHHGGFNNDEYAILNIPVVQGVFALRIGVDISDESGYVDNYQATPTGADYPPVDGRRRLLATAAGDSYCAEVLCQIISSPFTTLSVLTNYIFYSFYILCISCLQIIFMYVAVTPV